MVQAGYSGSGLNEVVWMGDVVNEASNLCGYALENIWAEKSWFQMTFTIISISKIKIF